MDTQEINTPFFNKNSLKEAKKIILSPIYVRKNLDGKCICDEKFRWKVETVLVYEKLKHFIKPGAYILDFGIGIGRISKLILQTQPDVRIVGVDSSPQMLEYARHYIPQKFFQQGSIQLLTLEEFFNFPESSFDLAMATYVLQHISSDCLDPVLKKINLCLKNSSCFFVLNSHTRLAINPHSLTCYDDKLNIKEKLDQLFYTHEKIIFDDVLMKGITRFHFCEVYHKNLKVHPTLL